MAEWVQEITPSGIRIEFNPGKHKYRVDGQPLPTNTEILSVLNKPAMGWWGMKIGVAGTLEVLTIEDETRNVQPEEIIQRLTAKKLTVNHVRDKGGSRGSSVHRALEVLVMFGEVPDTDAFPLEEQGCIRCLREWFHVEEPEFLRSEVKVASVKHGFAGTYDFDCRLPKRGNILARVDAKTGKRLYDEVHLQLEGYEIAAVESGYPRSDARYALFLSGDGVYKPEHFLETVAEPQHFLDVLAAWRSIKQLGRNIKAGQRVQLEEAA